MKRLLSLLAIFPAVYAEPLFQDNAMGSAFNSIMSQISPTMANYLYTFILVFAVSQFALSLIQPGDNAQRNSAAIAAALGLGSAFFVYITGFNAIGASIPFIVFIIVGVLSLMVWNVYQQFGNAGAAWVSSGIASIGLMIIGGIMHNIGTQITYYSELTGQDLSSSMTLSVLGMLAPYFILGGVLGLILSAIMAYRALFPGGGGGGPVPPGPPGGGGGGGGQQQQQQGGGGQQQQQQQQMMLIQQLMPLLIAYNNVQNQQNIQQLVNALNIQQNVNQVINQPINVILAQQLVEQLNRNQPRQDNGAILQLIIQLLTNLGQPVVEAQVDEAQIVTPSLITIYRGVVNKMKLNIMIPNGSEKNYFLQFKNLELLELSLERGDSITFGLGPFRKSILANVIIQAKEEIPIGEQEFIAELTDENHKVIQTSKTTVRIVAKEEKETKSISEESPETTTGIELGDGIVISNEDEEKIRQEVSAIVKNWNTSRREYNSGGRIKGHPEFSRGLHRMTDIDDKMRVLDDYLNSNLGDERTSKAKLLSALDGLTKSWKFFEENLEILKKSAIKGKNQGQAFNSDKILAEIKTLEAMTNRVEIDIRNTTGKNPRGLYPTKHQVLVPVDTEEE